MVFFVRKYFPVQTDLFTTFIALLAVVVTATAAGASTSHYPDVVAQEVSDNHLILTYVPLLSDDLSTVGETALYPYASREVTGRVILVAVPPGGDISFSSTFRKAGSITPPADGKYITAETPLVVREGMFSSRGHRFVRLLVFPQRLEDGRLAVYSNFVIDVTFTGTKTSTTTPARISRMDSVMAGAVINPRQFYSFGAAETSQAMKRQVVNPFAGSQSWARIAVTESGVTRLTGAQLAQAGFNVADLKSDSLRIFYTGGVNPDNSPAAPDLELYQIAISIVDGGDGNFGTGDYLLFYAEAPSRFEFVDGHPNYLKNSYSDRNYYWLAIGGQANQPALRWATVPGAPSGSADAVVTKTRQSVRVEQDKLIKVDTDGRIRDYFDWYWSNRSDQVVAANLPDCVPGDSISVMLSAVSTFSGTTLTLNGVSMLAAYVSNNNYHFWNTSGAAVSGLNSFDVHISSGVGDPYLDYLNIDYSKYLRYAGHQMELNSTGHAGYIEYVVSGYSTSHQVLDITDSDAPKVVSGVKIVADTAYFERPELAQSVSRYFVYASGDVNSPTAVDKITVGALRNDVSQYDCVAIAPRRFLSALDDYVQYRLVQNGYRIKLAAVEDIYDEFGFGLESPMAIRSYLRYAYEHFEAPAPFAALLVGDGHYDYLDNLGLHTPSYIPPFLWDRDYSAGDDNYVYFGQYDWLDSDSSYVYQSDRGWDMMIARWPVRSTSEIADHIAAIKQYESPEGKGSWRSRITYVADDEFKHNYSGEIIHTAQAETLAVYHTPAEFVKQKIYLTDYPFASNGEKPAATDDIIKAVNDGTLMLNYIGHGSPDVWADEHVLRKSRDLGRMTNVDKPTVIIAGSCSIGFFDDPGQEGMAEVLFRQPGGAIETVSATRLVYATDNAIFNYDLYDGIFGQRLNISEATYAAKMMHQYGFNHSLVLNDRTYVVFGDPLGKFGIPEYHLMFSADDSVLTPLQQFAFTGTVTDDENNPAMADGMADITVFDSKIVKHHPLGIDYSLGGPVIFRGSVEVHGGQFSGAFMVPLDVDYGGLSAKINGYADFGTISAIGGLDSLAVALTAATTTDDTGPEIGYRFDDVPDFVSGDRVPTNATVSVTLDDESGINLTGGLGHRIELVVDNDNSATVNLTDRFTYTAGSYKLGNLEFALPDLTPEKHLFRITAWDNANNPSSVEFEAVPSQESRIAINEVLNWPNPMEERTEFFFDLSESAESVELQIFTLAGRLIKSFRAEDVTIGRNRRFVWDGRDMDGDRVAQGVYIYKITARGRSGNWAKSSDTMAEAFGKVVVLN